jgi:Acetyltransferase (GNAT) family
MGASLTATKEDWTSDLALMEKDFNSGQSVMLNTIKYGEVSQYRRIINKLRYGLVLQVIRNKLAKAGIEFTPYYWFQAGIGDKKMPEADRLNSEYSAEFLNEKEMKFIAETSRGYTESDFVSRLKDGKLCLGLKHNNKVVSFMWIYLNECTFGPRKFRLNNDEAYVTDMYTMESYRGNKLAPFLEYKNCEILNKMGRYKIFSAIEYFNSSARKYKVKLNSRKLELVLFVRLFKKIEWSFKIKSYC